MPKPIKDNIEAFYDLLEFTVDRGYEFELVHTPASDTMSKPRASKRFWSIWWSAPTTSLWDPIQCVAMEFYRPKNAARPFPAMAIGDCGISPALARKLQRAIHPYKGYQRPIRKTLLEITGLW